MDRPGDRQFPAALNPLSGREKGGQVAPSVNFHQDKGLRKGDWQSIAQAPKFGVSALERMPEGSSAKRC
jgi:hypothetical protein